jgi:hypothetical protein
VAEQSHPLQGPEGEVGDGRRAQAAGAVLPQRLGRGHAEPEHPGGDRPGGERRQRPGPELRRRGGGHEEPAAEAEEHDGLDGHDGPQPAREADGARRVAAGQELLSQVEDDHQHGDHRVDGDPGPRHRLRAGLELAAQVELVDVQDGRHEGQRREHEDARHRDAGLGPRSGPGGHGLEGDGRPVRAAEKGGSERGRDRPGEVAVGAPGEHEQLHPGEEHQHGGDDEERPHPRQQLPDRGRLDHLAGLGRGRGGHRPGPPVTRSSR